MDTLLGRQSGYVSSAVGCFCSSKATVCLEVYPKYQTYSVCEEHVFLMREPSLTYLLHLPCKVFLYTHNLPVQNQGGLHSVLCSWSPKSFRGSGYFFHTESGILNTKVIFILALQIFADLLLLVKCCFPWRDVICQKQAHVFLGCNVVLLCSQQTRCAELLAKFHPQKSQCCPLKSHFGKCQQWNSDMAGIKLKN